jgi:hypothetical protein
MFMKWMVFLCLLLLVGCSSQIDLEMPEERYLHEDILTTYFWIGEGESEDNNYISNAVSAWDEKWVEHYGGYDDPECREGFYPCGFVPSENPFYCALPYEEVSMKNKWVEVIFEENSCYCQVEDVGPYYSDDVDYVLGGSRPRYHIGLDVSPAVRDCLGLSGWDNTSWRFVEEVPEGPWKEIVTESGVFWY